MTLSRERTAASRIRLSSSGTIQKKRDFYEKLSKNFFARVHIFYDSIFWQYSFFVNIPFVYSDKLQFWKKCHLVSMATRLFTRRFGAEKCLETCWNCSQRSFLAEAHTVGDWYPSASFSSTLSKQWGLLQSLSCVNFHEWHEFSYKNAKIFVSKTQEAKISWKSFYE